VDGSAEDCSCIIRQLRDAGHEAVCAGDATAALELLDTASFDAIITEWMLSDTSALELVDSVRRSPRSSAARVLVASRRGEPRDIARALDHGIDDYLIKPYRPEELLARVNAALRRPAAATPSGRLQVGPVTLDRVAHRVLVNSSEIELAPAEFRLIDFFMENRGRVFGRRQLLAQVWHRRKGIGERTVDVHVRRLRAALAPYGCDHLLQTVRGFGYRFG
jgi:two-component system phosphate regulon response regulator PhoB